MNTEALCLAIGARLRERGQTVATAESCTGGMIAAALTDIAGSSDWFGWGFVSYANAAKCGMLGVNAASLASHGAVSEAVVREMADGARKVAGADWAISVSGIAGPGGGSADKPVGTVWLAIAGPDGGEAWLRHFSGDRAAVRQQTLDAALTKLAGRLGV
ncbi:CinA family protein [Craterilacuibacter sp.]|uniref:CinA family protein n=1 Tax=Craterilacuibacter sp. TaxID=2870909 RepID=UPI003F2ECB1C